MPRKNINIAPSLDTLAPGLAKLAKRKGMKLRKKNYDPSSFGNAVIELESVDFDLRVVRDRGEIGIEVSPSGKEDWHDVVGVLAFIGEDTPPADSEKANAALSARYDQVATLMSSDLTQVGFTAFEKKRAASFLRTLFPSANDADGQ